MSHMLVALVQDETGQSLTEYALIFTLVAVVTAGAVGFFGGSAEGLLRRLIRALR